MKKIDVSSIIPNSLAEGNFYTESGELLIAKGTIFSQKYIDALSRRNIFEVYMKAFEEEEEEIHQLMSKEFAELEELKFDDPSASGAKIKKKKTGPGNCSSART